MERPQPLRKEFHSRVIGEAFGTYLLVEYSADELMFIDKHAAHERLLYERLKRENAGGEARDAAGARHRHLGQGGVHRRLGPPGGLLQGRV